MTITTRFTEAGDREHLIDWLLQPGVLDGFPLADRHEVEDAANICIGYVAQKASLTALWDGVPCGIANLYLQPFRKIAHHALFMIVVDEKRRRKGVGERLLKDLFKLAKEQFHLEFVHLEVYEGNPAMHLYQKLGFERYGVHRNFLNNNGRYVDKILMQKYL